MKEKIQYHQDDLVALIKNKDQKAFSYLYDTYSKALFGIIYTIVGNYEKTEDLVQSAFIKIWNTIDAYDSSKGQLYTCIIIIARNVAIDYQKSKENINVSNNLNEKKNGFKEGISSETNSREATRKEHLQLIELAYTKGYSLKEISEKLKISLETVQTKMREAILFLREELTEKTNV